MTPSAYLVKKTFIEVCVPLVESFPTLWTQGAGVLNANHLMDKRTQMQEEAVAS
jgi:hypothetical protein